MLKSLPSLLLLSSLLALPLRAQNLDTPPNQLTVMTWNVEWMFDNNIRDNRSKVAKEQSAPSEKSWRAKLEGVANVLAQAKPHIVALQEIEGDQTLKEIARQIKMKSGLEYRYAFVEGTDTYLEQDVGILSRSGLVSFRRNKQSRSMRESGKFYNVSKHLIAEFRWRGIKRPMTVMTVHYRATEEAENKRVKQARLSRYWLEAPLQAGHDVIILGDFNSEHSAGTRRGDIAALAGSGGAPPLFDLIANLPNPKSPTHLILNRQFDRIMASQSLLEDESGKDWSFEGIKILDRAVVRGRKDGREHWDDRLTMDPKELDLSDHHPVVATFRLR